MANRSLKAPERALVVVDLPFGTYQGNSKEALASAIRVMKETHADCIKLEGGSEIRESIERILCAGIPIMGHLGLTPQSINKFGTYTVRAREEAEANKLIEDAHLLEEIGCFAFGAGEDPGGVGSSCRFGAYDPGYRHWRRWRRRWSSVGYA